MTVMPLPPADLLLEAVSGECEAADPDSSGDSDWASVSAPAARLRVLVDRYFDTVWCALRRLGVPPADLDDCAQQVFVIASRKLAAIEQGRERGFLLGTAVRVASHARRAERRRREVSDGLELVQAVDGAAGPDECVDQKRLRAWLDEVLSAMPDELRAVFVLFELEELSSQEIARHLELPLGTVASRLRRAREVFSQLAARRAGLWRGETR
jgi:RNA polymerase sigma-70 factor, ECF subfamily